MNDILLIKNIEREGPGLLKPILAKKGISYTIIDLSLGDELPDHFNWSAVIVLGGPTSANDNDPIVIKELNFIKKCLALNIPYLGICLGLQLMVKACGGKVTPSKTKEIGFHDQNNRQFSVNLLPESNNDPLFNNFQEKMPVFQLHGETVTLTKDMTLIASGKWCENQIVRYKKSAYGIQCHFELTEKMLALWLDKDDDLKKISKEKTIAHFNEIEKEYTSNGIKIFNNFIEKIILPKAQDK